MSDLPHLLFVCQHIPVTKSLVISILKILTNASNNNYANDPLAFRLYCTTLCCLNCLCSFPVLFGEGCWIRLYRFLIIAFSSTLVELKLLLYDSFWFSSW